ncbi:MAG: ester cyclase [Lysobacterales bacterium]
MKRTNGLPALLTVLFTGLLLATSLQAAEALERNKQIVRLQAQAYNERDLDLLAQTTADDLLRHCQATPDIQVDSLEDFVAFLKGDWETFPDAMLTIEQMVAEGDRVAAFVTYTGTQTGQMGPFPPSGKTVFLEFIGLFRIENDKIAEIWVTWDNLAVLTQLGHFPPPQEG